MTFQLDESQRAALRAFCDTVVPRVEHDPDPHNLWRACATDLDVDAGVEELIGGIPDEVIRGGLVELLGVIADQGLDKAPSQLSREQIVHNLQLASPDAAAGIAALTGMTLFLHYGAPDPATGQNPNWQTFGYPGPASPPPQEPKAIEPLTPDDGSVLEADVCVVGSGSGGAVIAGALAQGGAKVIVLEASGYYNESDFSQLELKAYQEMYWRGGPTPTAGYIGFGVESRSKQSADKTLLLDAYRDEAEILVHTRAQRVLVEGGRAAGVEAVYVGADGTDQRVVTHRAPHVVVACEVRESP